MEWALHSATAVIVSNCSLLVMEGKIKDQHSSGLLSPIL